MHFKYIPCKASYGARLENHWSSCFHSLKKIYFLVAPGGMWDLRSPTRDRTHATCSGTSES